MELGKEINKEEFRIWIDALYSGKFPQGKNALQSSTGYCCLGVACKVLIPENKLEYFFDGLGNKLLNGGLANDQPYAPEWLSRINSDFMIKLEPTCKKNEKVECLIGLNDLGQATFPEIADLLVMVYELKILD